MNDHLKNTPIFGFLYSKLYYFFLEGCSKSSRPHYEGDGGGVLGC